LTSIPEVIDFLKCKPKVEASSQALMAVKRYYSNNLYNSQRVPRHMTGLHLAAYFGVQEAVNSLLDSPSKDPKDSYGRTPLSWAAEEGHEGVVKLLLEIGKANADLGDEDGWTPLSRAAWEGHEGIAKLLLEIGKANADLEDSYGRTPLSRAAERGHEAVVKLLDMKQL
jgi:ankyrin repeat protein